MSPATSQIVRQDKHVAIWMLVKIHGKGNENRCIIVLLYKVMIIFTVNHDAIQKTPVAEYNIPPN